MNTRNYNIVVAVTGGGSQFLSDRLIEGGASEYLLEAYIPYSQKSLDNFVGGVREKYCSDSTARQMAMECYDRAMKITSEPRCIGLAASCSLAKAGTERSGREHKIYIAAVSGPHIVSIEWSNADQIYSRKQEEKIAADLLFQVGEIFCEYMSRINHKETVGLKDLFRGLTRSISNIKVNIPSDYFQEKYNWCYVARNQVMTFWDKTFSDLKNKKNPIIYPGSFNPFHGGHKKIFEICHEFFGEDHSFLEICINNYDKAPIDAFEVQKRIIQIKHERCLITSAPRFIDKFHVLSRVCLGKITFAVGSDTFARIPDNEREYLNGKCKFLIFQREGYEIHTDSMLGDLRPLFHPLSFERIEVPNISSTEIRKK